jgi:transcriptional regulator with XRE-family HTH domain
MSKDVEFKNRDRFIQLGITIAALRKVRGMSQYDLAEAAGISRSHLSSIEAPNIVRPFSVEVLYNIADALEINAGDLLNSSMFSDEIIGKKNQ